MKKTFIIAVLLAMTFNYATCQSNFKWEKIDSINKSKDLLYSDTKMFIANYWKSSKDVIQNDDKEVGVILIKATKIMNVPYALSTFTYTYNYTVTFRMKENKYKINIDNVYCNRAYCSSPNASPIKIEPFEGDNCPKTTTLMGGGITKDKAQSMMNSLIKDLQSIIDDYVKTINVFTNTSKENGW